MLCKPLPIRKRRVFFFFFFTGNVGFLKAGISKKKHSKRPRIWRKKYTVNGLTGAHRIRVAMGTCRGVRVSVSGRCRRRGEGNLALTPAQMTTNLPTHLRAAGMEVRRYTMHSFRMRGAASHNMDGTAMDLLMKTCVGSPQPSYADT